MEGRGFDGRSAYFRFPVRHRMASGIDLPCENPHLPSSTLAGQRRKHSPHAFPEALRLQPRGEFEARPQFVNGFIVKETGGIGSDLEQNPARSSEINGMEILPVPNLRDVVAVSRSCSWYSACSASSTVRKAMW